MGVGGNWVPTGLSASSLNAMSLPLGWPNAAFLARLCVGRTQGPEAEGLADAQ